MAPPTPQEKTLKNLQGRPFVVRSNFPAIQRPSREQYEDAKMKGIKPPQDKKHPVTKGMIGEILGYDSKTPEWVFVRFWLPLGKRLPHVWFPFDRLDIGYTCHASDYLTIVDHGVAENLGFDETKLKANAGSVPLVTNLSGGGQFARAVYSLLDAMKRTQNSTSGLQVKGLNPKTLNLLRGDINNLTQKIVDGVKTAGLLNEFNKRDFTVSSLVEAATMHIGKMTPQSVSSKWAGIYLRAYLGRTLVYGGKTIDMYERDNVHYRGTMKPENSRYHSRHYRQVRPNEGEVFDPEVFVLCSLPTSDDATGFMNLAEQVFVILLEMYELGLYVLSDEELTVTYLDDAKNCRILSEIGRRAQATSNWPGGCKSRAPGHAQPFGAKRGLNWKSPIAEMAFDKNIWARTEGESHGVTLINFQRMRPIRIAKDVLSHIRSCNLFRVKPAGVKGQWDLYLDREQPQPAPDSLAFLRVEIRKDCKEHPHCWARLPKIGPYEDWERANSIAFQLTFVDQQGKWHSRYMQPEGGKLLKLGVSEQPWGKAGHERYFQALGIIRYFLHEQPSVPIPQLDYDLGKAFVKVATYSHLTRTHTFVDFDAGPQGATPPITSRIKMWQWLVNDMNNPQLQLERVNTNAHGFINVHGLVAARRTGGRRRELCDRCQWRTHNNAGNRNAVNCSRVSGTNTCHDCLYIYGSPCSYTRNFPVGDAARAQNLSGLYKRQCEAIFQKVKSVQLCPEIPPPDFSGDV